MYNVLTILYMLLYNLFIMKTIIWWLRRDIRLSDNQALSMALANADNVIPLFILDSTLWASDWVGEHRTAFLMDGLRVLDEQLRARDSYLVVRRGHPESVLHELMLETGATMVYAEEDYTPYARKRDAQIANAMPFVLVPGLTVFHPTKVLKKDGGPYTVFTPYRRTWQAQQMPTPHNVLPAPTHIPTPQEIPTIALEYLPKLDSRFPFPAGELEAQNRLTAFVDGASVTRPSETGFVDQNSPVYTYAETRNHPAVDGTAQLSPYMRFGMLSARQAVVSALVAIREARTEDGRNSAEIWLSELIWREFYQSVLYHFPHVRSESFNEKYLAIAWANDEIDFEAWKNGKTGYPLVDAAMRQLRQTGWMHNRARMIVASFLTKDLLIDWRWGEKWFMQNLLDGDPAANNGGWQWAAGTGTDAAPYFRIFNPITQSEKFDARGEYIRRWVPELRNVPDKYIHAPWKMPENVQLHVGCEIGADYPAPIVDHKWARERTLNAYKQARESIPAAF